MNVLEEVSIRLHRRQTISHVQGEYDGAIPPNEIQDVAVEQEDIDLMWKLFDYAALSRDQRTTGTSGGSMVTPTPAEVQDHRSQLSGPAAVGYNVVPDNNFVSEPHEWPVVDTQPQAPPDRMGLNDLFPGAMEDFDVPQEFTEDWSFFGRPWSAYFSEDSGY